MTATVIIITIYILGCILSYGRVFASFYEIEEKFYIEGVEPSLKGQQEFFIAVALLSWLGFFSGVSIYFSKGEKYLLKYSLRKLKHRNKTAKK